MKTNLQKCWSIVKFTLLFTVISALSTGCWFWSSSNSNRRTLPSIMPTVEEPGQYVNHTAPADEQRTVTVAKGNATLPTAP